MNFTTKSQEWDLNIQDLFAAQGLMSGKLFLQQRIPSNHADTLEKISFSSLSSSCCVVFVVTTSYKRCLHKTHIFLPLLTWLVIEIRLFRACSTERRSTQGNQVGWQRLMPGFWDHLPLCWALLNSVTGNEMWYSSEKDLVRIMVQSKPLFSLSKALCTVSCEKKYTEW